MAEVASDVVKVSKVQASEVVVVASAVVRMSAEEKTRLRNL